MLDYLVQPLKDMVVPVQAVSHMALYPEKLRGTRFSLFQAI